MCDEPVYFCQTTTKLVLTFPALAVQADNAVVIKTDVTTNVGSMHLDGDQEDSNVDDMTLLAGSGTGIHWSIRFTDGRTITAQEVLTLEATDGFIVPEGSVTFRAGSGIRILDDLRTYPSGSALVINADYDLDGDGT